jgi:hypothetical protein
MDADQIALALDSQARQNGDGSWTVRCPAHDDKHASLSLSDDGHGKVLWFCHAGCPQSAVQDELQRRGLIGGKANGRDRTAKRDNNWRPVLPVPEGIKPAGFLHPKHGRPSKTWKYLDAEGRLLFHICRFDGPGGSKIILPRSYGSLNGEAPTWHWKAAPAPRPLYGLQRLAKRPSAPAVVVEGEKVADAARKLLPGHVVITWPGGCKATSQADWRSLRGRNVVVWPDNDDVGRKAAMSIAGHLAGIAAEVRVVNLPAGLPEGWDLADDLPEGLEPAALIEAAAKDQDTFTMREFCLIDLPPLRCLVEPVLVLPGMTMLHARAGHGKTRLGLSIGYAVATGAPLMDWTVAAPGTVCYIDAELSPGNMKAWLLRLGRTTKRLHILSDKLNYHLGRRRVSLEAPDDRAYLAHVVGRLDPALVILDSLFVLTPPQMTEGKVREDTWSHVVEWIGNLKRQGRHVLLLHHDSKEGTQYGQSIKEIEFDLMMQLRSRPDYSGLGKWAFELTFTKPRHLSAEDAKPRIITATDDGIISWQRTDLPIEKRQAKAADRTERVAELLRQGRSVAEIAAELGISERRVRQIRRDLEDDGGLI